MLPVTPAPYSGEHLASYLVRLAGMNGLESPTRLAGRLMGGGVGRSKLRLRFEPAKLAAVTGHNVDQLFANQRAGSQGVKLRGLGDIRIGRPLSAPMWCFACVSEQGYVEAPWQFAPVTACFRHGTRGNTKCLECGVILAWERASLAFCTCGAALQPDSHPDLADPVEVAFAELIARASLGYRKLDVAERLGVPVSGLEGASVGALCRLILILGTLVEPQVSRDPESQSRTIRSGIGLLTKWPQRLHSAIERGVATQGPDFVNRIFQAAGLLGRDRRRIDDFGICYRLVADAVFAYLDATGPWSLDARLADTALGGRKFQWQRQSQVLAELGMLSSRKMVRLVNAGLLTSLGGTRYRQFQRPVAGLDISIVDFIRYREAVAISGLPVDTFHYLRKAGAFSFVGPISRRGMTRHQAHRLRRALDEAARAQPVLMKGVDGAGDEVTVGACLASSTYARAYKRAMVSRLLAGEPIATSPQDSFLALQLLPTAGGKPQASSPDAECGPNGWLGLRLAGDYLGCSTKTVRLMISTGRLKLAKDQASRHPRIALKSLRAFSGCYQSIRDIADALGITSNRALGRLRRHKSAALLSVGRGTTPFVRRSAVPDLGTLASL